jgi:hypothetical protein
MLSQAMPDHLEASFKSNKSESTDEDASSTFEMNVDDLTLKIPKPHTSIFLSPKRAQINSKISSRREWGEVVNVLGGVLHGVG